MHTKEADNPQYRKPFLTYMEKREKILQVWIKIKKENSGLVISSGGLTIHSHGTINGS